MAAGEGGVVLRVRGAVKCGTFPCFIEAPKNDMTVEKRGESRDLTGKTWCLKMKKSFLNTQPTYSDTQNMVSENEEVFS